MRPVTIALVVVVFSAALVTSGADDENERQKRFIGGILNIAKTFKNRVKGIVKDAGKAATSAMKSGFKFSSAAMKKQYSVAKTTFKKVAPMLDFNAAIGKLIPMIDGDFTHMLCEFACNGAANKVFQTDEELEAEEDSALGQKGCGPICDGGLAKLKDLAEG